jgi:hypothetical protein
MDSWPQRKGRLVYLDQLTVIATWKLLRHRSISNVVVLDAIKRHQKIIRWFLERMGRYVSEADFFAGYLKTTDGESVRRASRRLAGEVALVAAKEVVESAFSLQSLNERYGRNTLRLFVAKQLHLHIEYWTARVLVAQALSFPERCEVWLQRPAQFDGKLLCCAVPDAYIRFYPNWFPSSILLLKGWVLDLARDVKLLLKTGSTSRSNSTKPLRKPAVLTMQEDHIRADRSLRHQTHWIDCESVSSNCDVYVVKIFGDRLINRDDEGKLAQKNVWILPTSDMRSALKAMRSNPVLKQVRADRIGAYWATFLAPNYRTKYFLLRVAFLLRQAEIMGATALWLHCKVFLVRETYYSFADAMQLVAPQLQVTTIAYQYSNMGFVSPLMMSTADKFLLFSDMYKVLYQTEGIAPGEFRSMGYLYDGIFSLVEGKAKAHRAMLARSGAAFVICYFDESVQNDRWGLVSRDDHLAELHALADAVLHDDTLAVVVKSQFMFNSPSQLYPGDELIQRAKETGRYLELMEGNYRNDVYPTEAALIADLCIGHKFGATAALEAAIAGARTVLLDPYGTKAFWDNILAKVDVEYPTLEKLMDAIAKFRAGAADSKSLGDWSTILDYFDPHRDGKAIERLRKTVEHSLHDACFEAEE